MSGTLVGKWFSDFDESATIAANFLFSGTILVPATLIIGYLHPSPPALGQKESAVLLLLIGTLAAAAAGRVFYQVALTVTKNDNGFVTMFFLLVPGLSSLISLPLSWWIADLRFAAGPMFFLGLTVIAGSLVIFSLKSWRQVISPKEGEAIRRPQVRMIAQEFRQTIARDTAAQVMNVMDPDISGEPGEDRR